MQGPGMTESNTVEAQIDRVPALRWFALVMIFVSMALLTVRLIEAEPLRSANDRSRWCTVWAIVERGTYQIDEIQQRPGWDTIDRVKHNDHFYSSKPPLLPRIVAELYRLVRIFPGWTLDANPAATIRLLLFLINILPMGVALWYLCRIICRYCHDVSGSLLLIATACWATLLNPFLTTFNNHTVAATFLIFALYLTIKIHVEQRHNSWRYALCGLTAAFTTCNELPAAAFGLALFIILVRQNSSQTLKFFVPAAIIPIAAFMLTNYHATGGWKPFYMYYGTEKYVFVHEGVPSYWADPQGVDRAIDSPLTYLFHCTFGHHGVFSLTPVFLLSVAGWSIRRMWRSGRLKVIQHLGLGLTLLVFAFYMSKPSHYNYGGVSVALRWMLWLIPFWLLAMIPAVNAWGSRTWFQLVAWPLVGISLFSAWYPQTSPWTQPWLFDVLTKAEVIDYSTPRPQFNIPHRSWIGSLPTSSEADPNYWIEYTCLDPEFGSQLLRLQDRGPIESNGEILRHVTLTLEPAHEIHELYLRPTLFFAAKTAQGDPMKLVDCLDLTLNHQTAESRSKTVALLQGLPRLPAFEDYRASRTRPVRSPLRRDAFLCQIGSSSVKVKSNTGTDLYYSREVWFCSEVPFGTLQFEDRARTGNGYDLSRRLWTVHAMGKMNANSPVKIITAEH